MIESVVAEYLGMRLKRKRGGSDTLPKTGARLVYGAGHAALSFVSDPNGTDIIPPDREPPPGYHGP